MARIISPTRGAFIRDQLKAANKTQQAMADFMDVSIGRAHKILSGDDLLVSEALNVTRFLHLYPGALIANTPEMQPLNEDVMQEFRMSMHIRAMPSAARASLAAFLDAMWELDPDESACDEKRGANGGPIRRA
jgi:hypothetical protein